MGVFAPVSRSILFIAVLSGLVAGGGLLFDGTLVVLVWFLSHPPSPIRPTAVKANKKVCAFIKLSFLSRRGRAAKRKRQNQHPLDARDVWECQSNHHATGRCVRTMHIQIDTFENRMNSVPI